MEAKNTDRPVLSFDGCGVNGPDEYRSRIVTFADPAEAAKWGPMFAAAPALLAALERIVIARDTCAETGEYGVPAIESGDQSFDDWAADVACEAMTQASLARGA